MEHRYLRGLYLVVEKMIQPSMYIGRWYACLHILFVSLRLLYHNITLLCILSHRLNIFREGNQVCLFKCSEKGEGIGFLFIFWNSENTYIYITLSMIEIFHWFDIWIIYRISWFKLFKYLKNSKPNMLLSLLFPIKTRFLFKLIRVFRMLMWT